MTYVFYKKNEIDKAEAIFARENASLNTEEFRQKYRQRFKSEPNGFYNDAIPKEAKAIEKLQSQPEAYDYVILNE